MSKTRTQVYLTAEQRERLDEIGRREGKKLAELIREAVDAYTGAGPITQAEALRRSFGALPDLEVPPRSEWDRSERWER